MIAKNPRFHDAKNVCLDEVHYFPITDYVSAERRLRRGELDWSTRVQANRVSFVNQPGQIPQYVRPHLWLTNAYLMFNAANPKFEDKRVRQAIALAIDREFIVNKARRAGEIAAYSFVPPGVANYPKQARMRWADWPFEKRQAEARRLLREAGYTPENPLRFTLTHRGIDHGVLFPAIQADLKAVGVEAELIGMESQVAYAALRSRDFEVGDAGLGGRLQRPDELPGAEPQLDGCAELRRLQEPGLRRPAGAADNEPDTAERAEILRQAEQMVLDDVPVVPIFFGPSTHLVSPDITGLGGQRRGRPPQALDVLQERRRTAAGRHRTLNKRKPPAGLPAGGSRYATRS